jgi:hypothetical protein
MYEPTELILVNAATGERTSVWRTTPTPDAATRKALRTSKPEREERAAEALIHPLRWYEERAKRQAGS